MNHSHFTDKKTGVLIPIKLASASDYAFVPASLPPRWDFPLRLWPILAEAKAAIAHLNGIGKTLPDPELLLSPLKRREAIASSRIEGTYATAQELMLFEISPQKSKSSPGQFNSWREVANHTKSLAKGIELLASLPFCGKLIKELHGTLMTGVRGQDAQRGEWRTHQVAIGSDRRYMPPPKPQMEKCLDELERYINAPADTYDPLVRAFMVHYQFEAIHPFTDGNGRVGRVLLSLMIAQWCGLSRPWLYLSDFFEKHKDEYVRNLFRISTEGAWETWIEFCLNGTIQQSQDAASRCEKLGRLRDEMLERARPVGSPRTDKIIRMLFGNPIVVVSDLKKKLEVTYPTAQADVDRLVKVGILQRMDLEQFWIRPKAYYSAEIMKIAYQDLDES